MAKKKKTPSKTNTSSVETNSFVKGMLKDYNASFQPKESWYHARNAYNNSIDGDAGTLGNEPANLECGIVPYTIIGTIYKQGDEWIIYSTDDANSEIGLYDDSKCEYKTLVNAKCLNFNRKYLITGASKENYDCTWQVYWDDNLNPSRTLNIDDIPYRQTLVSAPGDPCVVYEDTDELDCEKIRLAPLIDFPCLKMTKAKDGGQLRNGAYQAFIAYAENGQVVTDYIGISNIQTLFDHDNFAGSIEIELTNIDKRFEEFELVILSNTNQQIASRRIGLYSTETTSITIDFIDEALQSIDLAVLFRRSPAYEKSESMYVVNDYLIRQGPTEQFDFNYQPLANEIKSEWVVAEYPINYYYKGGNKTGFMRDEQYAFFIRWIYNTGERSASYHIPGRDAKTNGYVGNGRSYIGSELDLNLSVNSFDNKQNWQVFNTASVSTVNSNIPTGDGGTIISTGEMGFWQSTETYPNNPTIWADLCGRPIRHHKMPSEETNSSVRLTNKNTSSNPADKIRILGVQFSNIKRPVFNDGTTIPNIVGYEILRGSRLGAKSILAKGIFRNMRVYDIPEELNDDATGLYPNYPYNDLGIDSFFHTGNKDKRTQGLDDYQQSISEYFPFPNIDNGGARRDVFTFHSPELMFRKPFLGAYEARFYGKSKGFAEGYFIKSEKHPQQKLLRNGTLIIASVIGLGYALGQTTGTNNFKMLPVQGLNLGLSGTFNPLAGQVTAGGGNIKSQGQQAVSPAYANLGSLLDLIVGGFTAALGGTQVGAQRDILVNTESGKVQPLSPPAGGSIGGGASLENIGTQWAEIPQLIRAAFALPGFFTHLSVGANEIIDAIYALMPYQDHALKHNSVGVYDNFDTLLESTIFRTQIKDSNYLGSSFQPFGDTNEFKVNNLFRPDTVGVYINNEIDEPFLNEDNSRYSLGQHLNSGPFTANNVIETYKNVDSKIVKPISSLYGALKFDFDNQYGQLEGIKQVVMRGCVESVNQDDPKDFLYSSQAIFSGDTYVTRYTEKTIMPIFTQFLNGQPNDFAFDYLKYQNIPYPRYWINSTKYDFTQIFQGIDDFITDLAGLATSYISALPSDLFCLDVPNTETNLDPFDDINPMFSIKYGYMYTHVNGIQDFFVESEKNMAHRDWEEQPQRRFYDIYTYNNVNDLFHADIIKSDNFYKYSLSQSVSRFLTNLSSYGTVQDRNYDPDVAEQCFTVYPKRLIYSLRAQEEAKKDFWRVFLPLNYKDFKDKVSVIKPINQTGALMFFPYRSPKAFVGVDQLQTDLGTKVILGDGGLFAREPQNITNSDLSNEYGSCESARSVINTPNGIYFISQAQGKIFNYARTLTAISDRGMKWWFNKYLPSILLRQYPELEETELADNPVVGIGCQSVYDVNNDVVYFMKRDYAVKEEYQKLITFDADKMQFYYQIGIDPKSDQPLTIPLEFGDDRYFHNASWTVSYDPKIKGWVSFHDWHPELSLPSINHFLTTKTQPTDEPYCPPGYYYNQQTNECEKLIEEAAPATVNIITQDSEDCECEDGFTLVYANPNDGFQYNLLTNPNADPNDCVVVDTQTTTINGNTQSTSSCDCMKFLLIASWLSGAGNFITIRYLDCSGTYQDITLTGNSQNETICARPFVQAPGSPLSPVDSTGTFAFLSGNSALFNQIVTGAQGVCGNGYPCCKCFVTTISNNNQLTALKYSYVNCNGDVIQDQILPANETNFLLGCIRENSVTVTDLSGNIAPPSTFTINLIEECGTYPCGPTTIVTTIEYPPICQQVDCFCPNGPAGTTVTQIGNCPTLGDILSGNDTPPLCQYFSQDTTTPSFIRGGIWRHNYRCDIYANYYGVDYPWEVEFVENTGQMVNTVRSVEYQLESYVYKGDLINGCGDDRWHDLDFNFDEAIISNSEQVSGLLRLELNPKENPFNILTYPIIGPQDIRILYSKEEQKYRFNQFWDITNDRGEFSNAEQNIFITQLNGYIKDLNLNNLDYQKQSEQRKKFRHYYNKVLLRRRISNNRKMLLKLNNTKLNLSFR